MKNKFFRIILFVLTISLLTTACTKSRQQDDGDLIVQTENNNVLNLGMDSVDTLNPILSKSVSVRECMQLIFEPLFSFDDAFNPIGVLAESCVASPDFKSYTIKLKSGILWHDNSELTAKDVEHTINLIRYNESYYSSSLSQIANVICVDEYTLVLKLSRPVPNFTALLSFPIVQQEATTEIVNYIPVGTGPYKYDDKVSSDKIKLVPNKSWRGNIATIDMIYLNVLKDNQSLINAYNANSVSVITSGVMDLRKNTPRGGNNINDYISNNLVFLGINNSRSEFAGSNTRQALSFLVDRDDIITTEIFSRAVPVKIPVNPSAWYYPKDIAEENGMDYIKELLALDGWYPDETGRFVRNGESMADDSDGAAASQEVLTANIIVNSGNDERLRIAKKIAASFSDFGIKTSVTEVSFEDYKLMIDEKNYSMFIGEVNLPYNMDVKSLLVDEDNYFAFYSEEMNDAIYQLGVCQSTEDEKLAFSNFSNRFLVSTPFVPLFFRKESVIFEKSVSGTSTPTMFSAFREPENWYISKIKNKTEQ